MINEQFSQNESNGNQIIPVYSLNSSLLIYVLGTDEKNTHLMFQQFFDDDNNN